MKMFQSVATPLDAGHANPAEREGDVDLQSDPNAHASKSKNLQDIFDSVGAEAVTSDVDLASGGSNSELGVQFVNSRFRTHFVPGKVIPYDPGTVFDINVYASDWIHGEKGFADSAEGKRTITPAAEISTMTESDQVKRTKKMEVWSLVKVRRNMSPEEWTAYTTQTLAALTEEPARTDMEAKLTQADAEYASFASKVAARQAKMLDSLTAQEKQFFGAGASPFAHGCTPPKGPCSTPFSSRVPARSWRSCARTRVRHSSSPSTTT